VSFTFTEEFELVLSGAEDESQHYEQTGELPHPTRVLIDEALDEFGVPRVDAKLSTSSFGHGADGMAIVLTLSGLLLAGKKIEENLDAWLRLAKRFSTALRKLRRRKGTVYLSEPAAAMFALNAVVEKLPKAQIVVLLGSTPLIVPNSSLGESYHRIFRWQPERYYVFTFMVGEDTAHVVCLRSTGEIEFHRTLPVGNWHEFYRLKGQ
jgi:hypothetical protein